MTPPPTELHGREASFLNIFLHIPISPETGTGAEENQGQIPSDTETTLHYPRQRSCLNIQIHKQTKSRS